ncbi:septation protein A [Sphingomonas sp. Leaf412]|uniref:inner membrane-spanning protein YciB n=1 Tax=Sphingomonas sp. Leaf412 TaxID=1736370 RepID=UPI0006F9BD09|nr:inner membrane-spanning protein YciB [Sphingomonas sp. Leaf412]KQT33508.1 septation protein A [Sphingomonas sp. Leaf412]
MTTRSPNEGRIRAAIDYGPLALFFLANFLLPAEVARRIVDAFTGTLSGMGRLEALLMARVIVATAVFALASAVALVVAKVKLGRIPPMLLISGGLVVVFGGLTMYFRDPRFIQMKPTIVYVLLAATLAFGLATGRPLLEQLLGTVYPGLSQAGWRRMTINWAIFFAVMAILNEAVWRGAGALFGEGRGWDLWTIYKLWIVMPATFLFAIANVPMLMRHGLKLGDEPAPVPPEG